MSCRKKFLFTYANHLAAEIEFQPLEREESRIPQSTKEEKTPTIGKKTPRGTPPWAEGYTRKKPLISFAQE